MRMVCYVSFEYAPRLSSPLLSGEHLDARPGDRRKDVVVVGICGQRVTRGTGKVHNELVGIGIDYYPSARDAVVNKVVSDVVPNLVAACCGDAGDDTPGEDVHDRTAAYERFVARCYDQPVPTAG